MLLFSNEFPSLKISHFKYLSLTIKKVQRMFSNEKEISISFARVGVISLFLYKDGVCYNGFLFFNINNERIQQRTCWFQFNRII